MRGIESSIEAPGLLIVVNLNGDSCLLKDRYPLPSDSWVRIYLSN